MQKITLAIPDDIPKLCELLAILFAQEADFEADNAKQSAALKEIIENPETGHILVLRADRDIIGMVSLMYTVSTACGGKVALLEDMIIRPGMRGEGWGRKLLQAAIEHAARKGCLRITLLTDRANEAAIRFYQGRGFTLSAMIPLRLNISPAPD